MAEPLAAISPGACARALPSTSNGINGGVRPVIAHRGAGGMGARLGLIGLNRMLRSAAPLIQVQGCSADGNAVSSVRNAPGVVPVSARSARVRWA
jgi:hypothetical protein